MQLESVVPAIPPLAPPSIKALTFELLPFFETEYKVGTPLSAIVSLVSRWSNLQLLGKEVIVAMNIWTITQDLLSPFSFGLSQIWYMPGFDDNISARLRTGAPCGNKESSGRSWFFDVAERICYSACGGGVGVKDDMICDANDSRSLRVIISFPLSEMSVAFDNQFDGQSLFLYRRFGWRGFELSKGTIADVSSFG